MRLATRHTRHPKPRLADVAEPVYRVNQTQRRRERLQIRITRAVLEFAHLKSWQRYALAFGLGAVSVLAVAPLFFWPVLLLTLPMLSLMLESPEAEATTAPVRASFNRAAVTGWWFGFGYFTFGLHWIVEPFLVEADKFAWLIPFAITLLPGGLALFFAAATALAHTLWVSGWRSAFPLGAAIGLSEWLRGNIFTGFPWNPIGDSLTGNSLTLQWAGLIGTNGLNVLAVILFTVPILLTLDALRGRLSMRETSVLAGCGILLTSIGLGYGWHRTTLTTAAQSDVLLRLVQPAIPQNKKWRPELRRWVFDQLLTLSRQNQQGRVDDLAAITHVIWPEAAMPFLPLRTPQALKDIAALLPDNKSLLTGALRIKAAGNSASGERETYNTLLAFDDSARRLAQYDKQHLVPFGEYLPFQSVLEAVGLRQLTQLRGGFSPGKGARTLTVPGLPPVTPLICYEVIFSGALITTAERPAWLLVVTNDAWFGRWAGPRQHFHQARVRAVEEGLPLVRVSNNGISGVITPVGRVTQQLALNARGVIDVELPTPLPPTLFARFGNAPFWFIIVLCILATLLARRRKGVEIVATQP